MHAKKTTTYNQIGFALEILKLLAEKPRTREDLSQLLSGFLENHGKSDGDTPQKLTRTIRKLRDCGIEIKSAPHHPYELMDANFPVILSPKQREALALAAYFLTDMGFSAQATQILRIGNIKQSDISPHFKVDFSPPADYSDRKLEDTVTKIQERIEQQKRYTIRYQNTKGEERNWDIDRSELRLHDGSLYLFAFVPDWNSWRFTEFPNVDQNRIFRIDKIINVGASSDVHWVSCDFAKIDITYRLSGSLANYQTRRPNETVIKRDLNSKYVEIVAQEDYPFWFRQRILRYGSNAQVLTPDWFVEEIRKEYQKGNRNYEKKFIFLKGYKEQGTRNREQKTQNS